MSSGDLILVREAAEDLLSADPVLCEVDLRGPGVGLSRWQLAQGAVLPGEEAVGDVTRAMLAGYMAACSVVRARHAEAGPGR
jgi:hypothetical protein